MRLRNVNYKRKVKGSADVINFEFEKLVKLGHRRKWRCGKIKD